MRRQNVRDYDERRVEVGARKRQNRARRAYRIVREQQNRGDEIIDEHHRFDGRDVTVIPRQLDIREWRRDGERQQDQRGQPQVDQAATDDAGRQEQAGEVDLGQQVLLVHQRHAPGADAGLEELPAPDKTEGKQKHVPEEPASKGEQGVGLLGKRNNARGVRHGGRLSGFHLVLR